MSDLPSSITSRVQTVEEDISSIRTRITQLEQMVDTNPDEVMRVLVEITTQLQNMRINVEQIRTLVKYS